MDLAERYRDVFAALARPLGPADGAPEEAISAAEQRLGVRLPDALRSYYALAGRMRRFNMVYDRLYPPEDLEIDRRVAVVMAENQGVFRCGVRATRSPRVDPAVYCKAPRDTAWKRGGSGCSDFLVLMVCSQGVNGAMPVTGYALEGPETVAAVTSGWGPGRRFLDLRAFYRPGQALCIVGPRKAEGGRFDILAGGRSGAEFEALKQELAGLGVRWLDVRRRAEPSAADVTSDVKPRHG